MGPRGGEGGRRGSMAQEMVNGLRYVATSPILATLLLMGLVPTLLGMPYQTFLPVFAKDIFGDGVHRNAGELGFMMTMTGVGALIGSLCVASMADFPRRALLQLFAGLSFGLSLAFFAVQTNFVLSVLGLALLGFSANFFQALNSSMLMSASDPRYYGRVMSLNMLTFALMPLGTLPIGYLADVIGSVSIGSLDLIGVQTTLMGAGLAMVVFLLSVTLKNPAYRRLDQSDLRRYAAEAADRMDEMDGSKPEGGSVWGQLRTARDQRRTASLTEGDPSSD
jgi:MFS family permease